MSRKSKDFPLLEGVFIESIGAEGQAIAHHDGQVIFVPFVAPGDVCTLKVIKRRKKVLYATLSAIEKPSPVRRQPACPHFSVCGGCKWQHVYYSSQLEAKEQQVRDAMERIAKIPIEEWIPIVGCNREFHYRNKVEFTFSNKRWVTSEELEKTTEILSPSEHYGLGFHIPGRFDKVLDIKQCHIADDLANRVRNFIRDFALSRPQSYTFFDLREQVGLLRTMMVRTSSTGGAMVLVAFAEDKPDLIEALMMAIEANFPQISSLLWLLNTKKNDTFTDLPIHGFSGKEYITEKLGGLTFKIGPKSFFQTNTPQAEKLYDIVRSFAALSGKETVYDLYTGTGTIANYVAPNARKVVGIEYVPEAIEDAYVNSKLNGILNTTFFAGDMKDLLTTEFIAVHGHPDVIITDPPRAGMHQSVIDTIIKSSPQRVVYVSCNPATQARDAAMLFAGGYKCLKSQPVDLFPQTHHVENVLLFERVS